MKNVEALVVGAGAVGVSTAYSLAEQGVSVAVVEKEAGPAFHQSGRNSGVIHAGYNLKPGTMKAEYCVLGNQQLREYCNERGVPVREGGILIVARDDAEMDVIRELESRGHANGTHVEMLDEDDISTVEPNARGVGALRAHDGASFDSRAYVHALASDATSKGVSFLYDRAVEGITEHDEHVEIETSKGTLGAQVVINAAGLYSDEVAGDIAEDFRVIPFRGYYAELKPHKSDVVQSHVYAAPDLEFPFLGVHLSKRTDGRVIVGPGAMLAFGREAYSFASLRGGRLAKTLEWPGFWRMLKRPEVQSLIRTEIRKSLSVKAVGEEAMQLVSGLEHSDFVRSYAGNRAQLVDREGKLVDDIVVRETPRAIHVLNAITPGLTCSLPFGKHLADRAIAKL